MVVGDTKQEDNPCLKNPSGGGGGGGGSTVGPWTNMVILFS